MSYSVQPIEQVFDKDTCEKLRRHINRTTGGVELYKLRRLVELVAKSQGKEIVIPEKAYRSCYRAEMLDRPKEKFLAPKLFYPDRKRLTVAVGRVRRKLRKMGKIDPISIGDSYQLLLSNKGDKNAGLPTLGRKQDDEHMLERAIACAKGKCPPPAVWSHRGKNTEDARLTWMFPSEWHVCEGAFFFPLQEKFKRNVPIYAAENAVNRRALINEIVASGKFSSKLAMDYSGFDASIGSQLIGISFGLLREHLQLDAKQEKLWNRVATYFATCPFVDQYGYLIKGRKGGVPSGSMFTQMIDTIVNAIVVEYIFATDDSDLKIKYFVYGDDSLIFTDFTVEELSDSLAYVKRQAGRLGITVNLKKTHICSPCEKTIFLGHYDLTSGRPVDEVLSRLIYPERPFEMTAANLATRVAAYMAESDEAMGILLPVYSMITAIGDRDIRADIDAFARKGMEGLTTVKLGVCNPRHLTGLAQFLASENPALVSSLWRIRASV